MRNIVTQDAFHSIARIPACALDRQDACHALRRQSFRPRPEAAPPQTVQQRHVPISHTVAVSTPMIGLIKKIMENITIGRGGIFAALQSRYHSYSDISSQITSSILRISGAASPPPYPSVRSITMAKAILGLS